MKEQRKKENKMKVFKPEGHVEPLKRRATRETEKTKNVKKTFKPEGNVEPLKRGQLGKRKETNFEQKHKTKTRLKTELLEQDTRKHQFRCELRQI